MKALVWHGDQRISYGEIADPEPTGGDDVLDVLLAGICGPDLHGYLGHPGPRVPPLVLGHEVVGRVRSQKPRRLPARVLRHLQALRRREDNLCAAWQLLGMHRAGVFAEHVVVPRRSLVAIPDGLDLRRTVLAEPLACCVGALAPHHVRHGMRESCSAAVRSGCLRSTCRRAQVRMSPRSTR